MELYMLIARLFFFVSPDGVKFHASSFARHFAPHLCKSPRAHPASTPTLYNRVSPVTIDRMESTAPDPFSTPALLRDNTRYGTRYTNTQKYITLSHLPCPCQEVGQLISLLPFCKFILLNHFLESLVMDSELGRCIIQIIIVNVAIVV